MAGKFILMRVNGNYKAPFSLTQYVWRWLQSRGLNPFIEWVIGDVDECHKPTRDAFLWSLKFDSNSAMEVIHECMATWKKDFESDTRMVAPDCSAREIYDAYMERYAEDIKKINKHDIIYP